MTWNMGVDARPIELIRSWQLIFREQVQTFYFRIFWIEIVPKRNFRPYIIAIVAQAYKIGYSHTSRHHLCG